MTEDTTFLLVERVAWRRDMAIVLQKTFNDALDRFASPEIHILHRPVSAFHVCGLHGVAAAVLLSLGLVTRQGLSTWVMGGLVLAAVLTFFALVMATKIITGHESIIYYHHEIAVMTASAVVLWLLRQPLLPYLDVVILGIGAFLACGRVGCLMVGCCHGRPSNWGVCYQREHVGAGFTPHLEGVRLFPVQALESIWVLIIVLVGSNFVLREQPGEALAWYVITYDLGRFCLEFARGDPARPYYWSFSQGQWISIILMIGVGWAEWVDVLPFHTWHIVITLALLFAMGLISLRRRYQETKKHLLLNPRHVQEIADAIQIVAHEAEAHTPPNGLEPNAPIYMSCTSLGIRISASRVSDAAETIRHFALSSQNGTMTEGVAVIIAGVIQKLKYSPGPLDLVVQNPGVFHLVTQSSNHESREVHSHPA
jgi:prolipoprotein diacylglyceryltransferase